VVNVIPEPLVTYYMDSPHTVSSKADWKYLYNWARNNRQLFSDRAYSFFLATVCVPRAAKQGESLRTFAKLLRECMFDGSPTLNCLAICFNLWFVPEGARQSVRGSLEKWKNLAAAARSKQAANQAS
jgi:hypothetical protein